MLIAIGVVRLRLRRHAVTTTKALPILHSAPASGGAHCSWWRSPASSPSWWLSTGHRTISVFQHIQVLPAFLIVCGVLALFSFPHWDLLHQSRLAPGPHLAAMALGFTLTFALIVSWVTYAGDYSRYLPVGTSGASGGAGQRRRQHRQPGRSVVCWGRRSRPSTPGKLLPNLILATVPVWFGYCFAMLHHPGRAQLQLSQRLFGGPLCPRHWDPAPALGRRHRSRGPGGTDRGPGPLRRCRLSRENYVDFLTITYVWFPAWAVVVILDSLVRHRDSDSAALVSRRGYWFTGGFRWPMLAALGCGTLATVLFFNEPPPARRVGIRIALGPATSSPASRRTSRGSLGWWWPPPPIPGLPASGRPGRSTRGVCSSRGGGQPMSSGAHRP